MHGTKLRAELGDLEGNSYYAECSQFVVGDSCTDYRMNRRDTVGMPEIGSPTTMDRCLLPTTKIITVEVGIVQSNTEGVGDTRTAMVLILTVTTCLEEIMMQKDSHGTVPNLVESTTPSRWLK